MREMRKKKGVEDGRKRKVKEGTGKSIQGKQVA